MRSQKTKTERANVSDEPHHQLQAIFSELSSDQLRKVETLCGPELWSPLARALAGSSPDVCDAEFGTFVILLKARSDLASTKFIAELGTVVGSEVLGRIGLLVQRIERLAESAVVHGEAVALGRRVTRLGARYGLPCVRALPYGELLESLQSAVNRDESPETEET